MQRGCTWQEGLDLDAADSSSAGAPMTVADYGSGAPPKLDPYQDAAIEVTNADYLTIGAVNTPQHGYVSPQIADDGSSFKALVSGKPITTFAGWKKKDYDANSVNANPLLSGPLGGGPGSYYLQAGSPVAIHCRNTC